MGKLTTVKLESCLQIVGYNYLFGFSLCDEKSRGEKYSKVENAIKAYLKNHEVEEGSILVYKSIELDPQRGGWYNPNRMVRYHRAVYVVTFDQLLRISNLEGDYTETEIYKVCSGKIKKVLHKELIRAWFDSVALETKKKWVEKLLEKMLFDEVLENPSRFL